MSPKPTTLLGVIGSRDFNGRIYDNAEYITALMDKIVYRSGANIEDICVVTGGGRGVETLIVEWASARSIPCKKLPPNIALFGKQKAFQVRNQSIVADCSELVVIWDGGAPLIPEVFTMAAQLGKSVSAFPLI
jgi:hypothetical protein